MKRILSILLACAMLVSLCLLTSCKQESNDLKLIQDGKLVIGTEASYPPFEMQKEDGSYTGYDIELIKLVAEKLGLELVVYNTSFDGILDGIGTNYDCAISAITILPEREETVSFTTPYITNYQAVVVKKGTEVDIKEFADLNGSTISLQKGTTSDDLIGELNDNGTITVTIVANESVTTCFESLKNGEVDYVVTDSTVAVDYVAQNPDDYAIAFTDSTEPEEFAIACAKADTALRDKINEALAEIKDEGTLDELYAEWFGKGDEQ